MEWPLGVNSRRSGTRHTRFRSNLSKRTLGGSRLVVSQVPHPDSCDAAKKHVAVGTRVTSRPPHRSVHETFPHTAPTSGPNASSNTR